MSLFRIGGYRWSPELVDWGGPGAGNAHEFSCYSTQRKDGKMGKLTKAEIRSRTVDVRDVEAVYALFQGQTLLYVGEGLLGACMIRHYRDDEFVGRWDSFTWFSPWRLKISSTNVHKHWLASPPKTPPKLTPKQLIEHIETIAIRLADPIGNRQNPASRSTIQWLTQLVPANFMTQEEKLSRAVSVLDALAKHHQLKV